MYLTCDATMIACGHNNIATAGLACAIAVKKLLEEGHTTGKVVLFGTPSEGIYIKGIRLFNMYMLNDKIIRTFGWQDTYGQ